MNSTKSLRAAADSKKTVKATALRMAARLPITANTVRLKAIAAQARAHSILRAHRSALTVTLTREIDDAQTAAVSAAGKNYYVFVKKASGLVNPFSTQKKVAKLEKLLIGLGCVVTHKTNVPANVVTFSLPKGVSLSKVSEAVSALKMSVQLEASVSTVSAAKDIGDAKGDKKRGTSMAALLKAAEHLLEDEAWASVPDITKAAEAVLSAGELVKKMTDAARKLSAMKTGADEAVVAQKELDELRGHVDAMLPGAAAALATLNRQGEKVVSVNADIVALRAALAEAERISTLEGVRLKAASQAVVNSLMLG